MAFDRDITALEPLHLLLKSFDDYVARGASPRTLPVRLRRTAINAAKSAGNVAIRRLGREVKFGSAQRAEWALYLLGNLAGRRVVEEIRALLTDVSVEDTRKATLLGLLVELGGPLPESIPLKNPEEMAAASMRDLAASLDTDSDFVRAAKVILDEIPLDELPHFLRELVRAKTANADRLYVAIVESESCPHEISAAARHALDKAQEKKSAKKLQNIGARRPPTSRYDL